MSARHFERTLVALSALALAHGTFVGCGTSDDSKQARDRGDGGGAGEGTDSGGSEAGPTMNMAGRGGSPTTGGTPAVGGIAGDTASAGEASTSQAGQPSASGAGGDGSLAGAGGSDGGGAAGVDSGGTAGDTNNGGASAAGSSGEAGAGGASEPCVAEGARITMTFDATNAERVTGLTWVDSDGTATANLAVSGGSGACGDPTEFFGQSYGVGEGTTPYVVFAGTRSTLTRCGLDALLVSSPMGCNDVPQIPVTTQYHFYAGDKASQVRVTRHVTFDEASPTVTGLALRTWQPRVSRATFPDTIYPNAAGTGVTTTAAATCGGDCLLPENADWNKQWFGMVGPSGLAVIVRRDPSLSTPINLTINWDSFSFSNLSSFVWPKPAGGFQAPLEEIEYLCLADLKSWPQTERDAAQLPAFCGP
jgi:hypothetical protein